MKSIFKKFIVSVATVVCAVCAFAGTFVSLNDDKAVANAETPVAERDFWIGSAEIRLVNDEHGAGIRFRSYISDSVYDTWSIKSSGTLMIPEHLYDGELTLDDMDKASAQRPVKVDTTEYWEEKTYEDDAVMRATAYIYDLPVKGFGWRMVARSYVELTDGSVVYSAIAKASISDIASTIANDESIKDDHLKFQVTPFIVENVDVTVVDLYGNSKTSTVDYGSKLVVPETCKINTGSAFEVNFYDANGKKWDVANGEFTRNETLTAKMEQKVQTVTIADTFLSTNSASKWVKVISNDDLAGETAPAGFTKITRFDPKTEQTAVDTTDYSDVWSSASGSLGANHFNIDVSKYSEVSFALKLTNGAYLCNMQGWSNFSSDNWIYFHLTQNSDATWNIEISSEGKDTWSFTNQNSTAISTDSSNRPTGSLSTILYDNGSASTDGAGMTLYGPGTVYSTEIIGVEKLAPENYPAYDAVKVVDSFFYGDTNVSWRNFKTGAVTTEVDAPEGFNVVTKFEVKDGVKADNDGKNVTLSGTYWDQTTYENYSEVWFAVKGTDLKTNKIPNYEQKVWTDWVYFHLTQTSAGVWTIEVTVNGEQLYLAENQVATETADRQPEGSLQAILTGAFASTKDGFAIRIDINGSDAVFYTTEVLAVGEGDGDPVLPDYDAGVVLSSASEDDAYVNPNTELGDVTAPAGFSYVTRWDGTSSWTASSYSTRNPHNNTTALTDYSEVWFAYKLVNLNLAIGWGTGSAYEDWIYFHLIQTGDNVWTIEMTHNGTTTAYTNQTGADTAVSTSGTIAAILYGGFYGSPVVSDEKGFRFYSLAEGTPTIYSTEVKAIRVDGGAIEDVELPSTSTTESAELLGVRVADTAAGTWLGSNLVVNTNTSEVTAPEGFNSVLRYDAGSNWNSTTVDANGKQTKLTLAEVSSFNASTKVDGYSEVWFAYQFVNCNLQNEYTQKSFTGWVYFHLTKEDDEQWTIEITNNGTVWKTYTDQIALHGTSTYNNTIAAILYSGGVYNGSTVGSDSQGFRVIHSSDTAVSATIYATEIRAKQEVWGKRAIWSAMDYSRPTDEIEVPYGFTQVYKRTEFNDYFAKMDLSNTEYTQLRFAMLHSGNFFIDSSTEIRRSISPKYPDVKTMWLVTLDKTESGWTVTMNCENYSYKVDTNGPLQSHTFNATGNSLSEIFAFLNHEGDVTVYTTEVRGSHTHTPAQYISTGAGTHRSVCFCGETIATENCSGTEATCTTLAVCSVCGKSYGTVNADNHTQATTTIVNENDTHTIKYPCCEEVVATTSCSGGTADCDDLAKCSVCGDAYGDYVHDFSDDYVQGEIKCSICGTVKDSLKEPVTVVDTFLTGRDDVEWANLHPGVVLTDVEKPAGFSVVTQFNVKESLNLNTDGVWDTTKNVSLGAANWVQTSITDYSKVWFAIKGVNMKTNKMPGYEPKVLTDWVYFCLTKEDDAQWTIEVTVNGEQLYLAENQVATETANSQPEGSIMAILQGAFASNKDGFAIRIDITGSGAIFYTTEVMAYKAHNHFADKYVNNGDSTHDGICFCGYVVADNVTCSGGTADCDDLAECTSCGVAYGDYKHGKSVWVNNGYDSYQCENCGREVAKVSTTTLEEQPFALYTNQAAGIAYSGSVRAGTTTLSLAEAFSDTSFTVKSATLTSETYKGSSVTPTKGDDGTYDVKFPIAGINHSMYGPGYTVTLTVDFYGKEFTITAPVTVVTNMITTDAGMKGMRYILRGGNATSGLATTALESNSMMGQGYYMLGANITLTGNTVYTFGISAVPFVGTFDGNGYTLDNYSNIQWFNASGYAFQDTRTEDLDTANNPLNTYKHYIEGSLFGIVNGTIKNVAFDRVRIGIYANLVHSGSGTIEDVYVRPYGIQSHVQTYGSLFFAQGHRTGVDSSGVAHFGAGTLKNVVIDLSGQAKNINTYVGGNTSYLNPANFTNPTRLFPAAIGRSFDAQNVAIYGFDPTYATSSTGNVYLNESGVATDGREEGIYATYKDLYGNAIEGKTDNGGIFAIPNLDNSIWKVVDDIPMLKNYVATEPDNEGGNSYYQPKSTADSIVYNAESETTEYYVAWDWKTANQTTFDAYALINNYAYLSTGASLKAGTINLEDESLKQIIAGTYAQYGAYVEGEADVVNDARANYGIYVEDQTIYVLGETDEAIMYAAKALANELFGYREVAVGDYKYDNMSETTISIINDYDTAISFSHRKSATVLPTQSGNANIKERDQDEMGFTNEQSYTNYVNMHNSLNYFYDFSSGSATMKNGYTGTKNYIASDASPTKTESQLCYLRDFQIKVAWVANEIETLYKATPGMTRVNFMIEDNTNYCGCGYCGEYSNPSIPQLIFLNEVATTLAKNNVPVEIVFFAYNKFQPSPALTSSDINTLNGHKTELGITASDETLTTTLSYEMINLDGTKTNTSKAVTLLKAHEGLRLEWTSHKLNHSFELRSVMNQEFYFYLLGWIQVMGGADQIDLFLYQTFYGDYFLPMNTWKYQVDWYQEFNKLGINSAISNLGITPWGGEPQNVPNTLTSFNAFKAYIDSRAMTDANVTYEQLKAEFFSTSGYYGAGGPKMLEYFNELEASMEERKAGGAKAWTNQAIHWWNDLETDYSLSDAKLWRQANYNGYYNLNIPMFAFDDNTLNKGSTVTGRQDLYTTGNLTQQATLERWYTLCQEALALVDANSAYAKRINVEAVFPEYAFLYFGSSYKGITQAQATAGTEKISCTAPTSSIFQRNYAQFYTYITETIGVVRLTEFYMLDSQKSKGKYSAYCIYAPTSFLAIDYYLYSSVFKNWGVASNSYA